MMVIVLFLNKEIYTIIKNKLKYLNFTSLLFPTTRKKKAHSKLILLQMFSDPTVMHKQTGLGTF